MAKLSHQSILLFDFLTIWTMSEMIDSKHASTAFLANRLGRLKQQLHEPVATCGLIERIHSDTFISTWAFLTEKGPIPELFYSFNLWTIKYIEVFLFGLKQFLKRHFYY